MQINNEKGYTLLFTFAAIIIFSILGLSLFLLTSNGLSRNEVRQNTSQSYDLAEKGVNYFSEMLNAELDRKTEEIKKITNSNTKINTVKNQFNTFANTYACKGLNSIDSPSTNYPVDKFKIITSDLGTTKICISKIEAGPSNEYSRLITFKSIGIVKGMTKETVLNAQSEVGYSYVPESLNYAVSTNDGGNLYMFGGIQVEGNIKASKDIYVSNKAFWSSTNNPKWVQSVLPRVKSVDNFTQPKVFSRNIYRISDTSSNPLTPSSAITKDNPSIPKTKIIDNNIHTAFHNLTDEPTPFLAGPKEDGSIINVSNIVSTISSVPNNGKYKNIQIKKHNGDFIGATKTNKDSFTSKHTTPSNNATYVSGKMSVGRYALSGNYSNDTSKYYDFELNGNYYVEKDLVISGAKLKGNAVIYVKGSVDIEFSTINAGKNEKNNTIFIFAEKPIEIHNISVNSSPGIESNPESTGDGSVINGFFYTNSNFLMYGVGSNTRITGGISAKHTTFTALRGHGVDELRKNRSDNTPPTDSSCIGNQCSCEKNSEEDREGSYLNQFEMLDKTALNEKLDELKLERSGRSPTYDETNLNNLISLLNNPYGGKSRSASNTDIQKNRWVKKYFILFFPYWELETINIGHVTRKDTIKEISFNTSSLLKTVSQIRNANSSNKDLNIYLSLIQIIYGNGVEDSKDQCLTDREQNDKGNPNNNQNSSNVGGYNYTSRLTIIYDNELIKRYTETNAIEVDNAEITVIPTNIKDLTIQ
ncbi:hypothetical protein [Solibacillus sp. FSL W8-0372]|uniref:hypothetical protein n=1 Tax=Solibacillus sp. FSL W8-0372 TaxID=2921713 RepID=UPI0030D0B2EC